MLLWLRHIGLCCGWWCRLVGSLVAVFCTGWHQPAKVAMRLKFEIMTSFNFFSQPCIVCAFGACGWGLIVEKFAVAYIIW
jgi:hypothetical protein